MNRPVKTKIIGFETIGMPYGQLAGFQRRKVPILKLDEPHITSLAPRSLTWSKA